MSEIKRYPYDRSRFDYIIAEDHFKIVDSLVNEMKELAIKRNELMELCVEIRKDLENRGRGENGLVGISPHLSNKLCELTKGK